MQFSLLNWLKCHPLFWLPSPCATVWLIHVPSLGPYTRPCWSLSTCARGHPGTLEHRAWFTEKAADPVLTTASPLVPLDRSVHKEGTVQEDSQPHLWFKKRWYTETAILGYEIIKRGFTHHTAWPRFPWRSGHAVFVDLIESRADMQIKGQTPVPLTQGLPCPLSSCLSEGHMEVAPCPGCCPWWSWCWAVGLAEAKRSGSGASLLGSGSHCL